MVIIFGQRNHITLRRYLQPAASTDFHVRTLEFRQQIPLSREHNYVESIAMAVTHQNIPSIAHINAIREISNILAADSSQELPLIREYDYTVTLEVADVELVTANSQIRWLAHVLAAIKPVQEVSSFGYDEYCGGNAVYGYDGAGVGDGQSGHDIYVADGDFLQKVAGLGEDLHSGSLTAPVANDKLTRALDYGNLGN